METIKQIIKNKKTKNVTNKQLQANNQESRSNCDNKNCRESKNLVFFLKYFFYAFVFLMLLKQLVNWLIPGSFNKDTDEFLKQLNDFFHIWTISQWTSSLVVLFITYWLSRLLYNKYFAKDSRVLEREDLIYLVIVDLTTNLLVGIYYMGHRETLLGQFMLMCPVAISPLIFTLELIFFYYYGRYIIRKQKQTFKK